MPLLDPTWELIFKEYQDGHINGYELIGRVMTMKDAPYEARIAMQNMIEGLLHIAQPFTQAETA